MRVGGHTPVRRAAARTGRRRRLGARDLALGASFAALIVVLGLPGAVDPFGSGVPITVQSLGVMLAGAVLGARRGALAALLVIALCAIGLPVLAGGRGGLGVFASPTVGFLLAWPVGAAVIGAIVQRGDPRSVPRLSAAVVVGGILVVHGLGIAGMMWRAHLDPVQAMIADAAFLPGDVVKAAIAVVVAGAVHRAFPGLLPERPARAS